MNPFWQAVCGSAELVSPPPIEASSLDAAAATSYALTGRRCGFRRPRELVDLEGTFRHFVFEGRTIVGKRTSWRNASRELWNSANAESRLGAHDGLTPLVPSLTRLTTCGEVALLSDDCGPSLAHDPRLLVQRLPWDNLLDQLDSLLAGGIEWPGFLPRNVIPQDPERLILIDWESCRFVRRDRRIRAVGDLTLLFWSIAWARHYDFEPGTFQAEVCSALALTLRSDPLDAFEAAYASMLPSNVDTPEIRRRCSAATIATESVAQSACSPIGQSPSALFGRAEVGHLLNELLPTHLSVLYTFASHEFLRTNGEVAYDAFVDLVGHVLVLTTPCDGFENEPARRNQLLFLLLAIVTAVLLEAVDPARLRDADCAEDLIVRLCDRSATVADLVIINRARSAGNTPLVQQCRRRFQYLSVLCLSADHRLRSKGLAALGDEVVAVAAGGEQL